MSILGAPSRFSVLKMDASDPRERKKPQTGGIAIKNNSKNNGAMEKNKQQQNTKKNKKKDNNNNSNTNSNNKKKNQQQSTSGCANNGDQEKFDQWKKRDEELVADMFEKELQQALLQSRLEHEGPQQHPPSLTVPNDQGAGRKGKVTLTLAEFHEKFPEEPVPVQAAREPLSKRLAQMKQQEEDEEALRKQSIREAAAIVTRERAAEEVRERAQQPRVVPQEDYDRMLEMKKKQIEHMAKVLNQTHKEMAILQEQNSELESLVAKGEMKKKVELIREVEELRQVKDELTDQIGELHVALEQEKSKVHQLTLQLQRKR